MRKPFDASAKRNREPHHAHSVHPQELPCPVSPHHSASRFEIWHSLHLCVLQKVCNDNEGSRSNTLQSTIHGVEVHQLLWTSL